MPLSDDIVTFRSRTRFLRRSWRTCGGADPPNRGSRACQFARTRVRASGTAAVASTSDPHQASFGARHTVKTSIVSAPVLLFLLAACTNSNVTDHPFPSRHRWMAILGGDDRHARSASNRENGRSSGSRSSRSKDRDTPRTNATSSPKNDGRPNRRHWNQQLPNPMARAPRRPSGRSRPMSFK